MAFMRMMGRDSVAYHQATVLGRADDHAGQSLDYYGTRGETPLVWGGTGAGRLGLDGQVTPYTYAAIFGEGGATDPVTGHRLVNTTRPGMELVVSPAQVGRGARRDRPGRRHARHRRRRDHGDARVPRRLVPGARRPAGPGPGPHRHLRAHLGGHPTRHLEGR